MGADLNIHVFTKDFTEEHYKKFQSHTLGSKFFNPHGNSSDLDLFRLCSGTPKVWVGSVSWLKAAILQDAETFIPNSVGKIHEIIGEEFPVIDDALIAKIKEALMIPNQTDYEIGSADDVLNFLEEHKGEKAFTISW